jgi:hypothetical protein
MGKIILICGGSTNPVGAGAHPQPRVDPLHISMTTIRKLVFRLFISPKISKYS